MKLRMSKPDDTSSTHAAPISVTTSTPRPRPRPVDPRWPSFNAPCTSARAGAARHEERHAERRAVRAHAREQRDVERTEWRNETGPRDREGQGKQGAAEREHQALGERLAHEAPTRGAKCQPDGQLALPRRH